MPASTVVLASGSPRRREILAGQGLEFVVRPVDIDEAPRAGEDALEMVRRLAEEKARAAGMVSGAGAGSVAVRDGGSELVIAADTIVELDGELLGKPLDEEDAGRMLAALSGRTHRVHTGVAVAHRGRVESRVEGTAVRFRAMNDGQIAWLVASGEPMDKAGAYAVQGLAAAFIDRIEGSYWNVVGLPVHVLASLVDAHGVGWTSLPRH